MQLTKTHKIILSIVAVAVLLGIYIAIDRNSKKGEVASTDNTTATSTTSTNGVTLNTKGNGTYTIEQVPLSEGKNLPKPVPDLNRPATSSASAKVAPEALDAAIPHILALQTQLKANNADITAWVNLGIYQKSAGDYQGAILSWQYASKLAGTDYVSVANIGNLYAYFLHDNAQAEIYYKLAISKGPTQVYLYTQLAEIYRDIFKDMDKARTIINQGLSKVPNDPSLLQFQASLN